jgi:hypothetical protein
MCTPPTLARQIVRHFAPSGRVLDPARGQGAFFKALVAYGCLTDWCELEQGRDFLQYQGRVDWVLTNPPWSKFLPFLKHAMRLAPNIVFLASLSHFMFKARLRALEEAGFGLREALLVPSPPSEHGRVPSRSGMGAEGLDWAVQTDTP